MDRSIAYKIIDDLLCFQHIALTDFIVLQAMMFMKVFEIFNGDPSDEQSDDQTKDTIPMNVDLHLEENEDKTLNFLFFQRFIHHHGFLSLLYYCNVLHY